MEHQGAIDLESVEDPNLRKVRVNVHLHIVKKSLLLIHTARLITTHSPNLMCAHFMYIH
jgi:hypothetical protein